MAWRCVGAIRTPRGSRLTGRRTWRPEALPSQNMTAGPQGDTWCDLASDSPSRVVGPRESNREYGRSVRPMETIVIRNGLMAMVGLGRPVLLISGLRPPRGHPCRSSVRASPQKTGRTWPCRSSPPCTSSWRSFHQEQRSRYVPDTDERKVVDSQRYEGSGRGMRSARARCAPPRSRRCRSPWGEVLSAGAEQGLGVGTALVSAVVNLCVTRGITTRRAVTSDDNPAALRVCGKPATGSGEAGAASRPVTCLLNIESSGFTFAAP